MGRWTAAGAAVRGRRYRSIPLRALANLSIAAAILVLATAPAGAAPEARTVEQTFDNGLKLITHVDRRAPIVVAQIWYRVGSSYEPTGLTGVSHALEHMMFKGTPRHGPGEFSRLIAARGGSENAFTGADYTAYFQTLERSHLRLALELEADRMRNLLLDPAEFAREIRVVMEERRLRTEDDPQAYAYEAARATAFAVSPYRQPVIGWMADLERLTVADLRGWYERWYTPANAVLVVAGDIDPDAVAAAVRAAFGALDGSAPPAAPGSAEPAQRGPKRAVLALPAKLPYLLLDYKAPSLPAPVHAGATVEAWEPYALELLADVLAGDDGARLPRTLVRDGAIAAEVGAWYDLHARLPTLLTVAAVPATGRAAADLEAAVEAELARVRDRGVEPAELERARTRLLSARIYRQDSLFYQAMEIGLLETAGLGWRVRERYAGALAAVTPEQVRAVARRYLVPQGLTVTTVEPQAAAP